jgi:hypothetical protein
MAKVYALIQFTDESGRHEVGEAVDLPRETPEQKADYQRYLDHGIVSTRRPEPKDEEPDGAEGGQRARRERS